MTLPFLGRLAAFVALVVPTSLVAQEPPPDLAELVAEAERNNPRILAAEKTAEAAAARVPQAGALPDPRLGVAPVPSDESFP